MVISAITASFIMEFDYSVAMVVVSTWINLSPIVINSIIARVFDYMGHFVVPTDFTIEIFAARVTTAAVNNFVNFD